MTEQEKDEVVNGFMDKAGITKWTKWKYRLGRRLNTIICMMIIFCSLAGIESLGIKFWSLLLAVMFVDLAMSILCHYYYKIKRIIRNKKRNMSNK